VGSYSVEFVLSIQKSAVIQIKLREMMKDYRRRTGERMTYDRLAERTGLSQATLASLASRDAYDTRLSTIEKLCRALGCTPGELLDLGTDEANAAPD
jgi:putative transcriptional regulator